MTSLSGGRSMRLAASGVTRTRSSALRSVPDIALYAAAFAAARAAFSVSVSPSSMRRLLRHATPTSTMSA